jgi:hypothetical protein
MRNASAGFSSVSPRTNLKSSLRRGGWEGPALLSAEGKLERNVEYGVENASAKPLLPPLFLPDEPEYHATITHPVLLLGMYWSLVLPTSGLFARIVSCPASDGDPLSSPTTDGSFDGLRWYTPPKTHCLPVRIHLLQGGSLGYCQVSPR